MAWDNDLANILNSRNNPDLLGNQIGVIESVRPLVISIMNGEILLDRDNLKIADSLYQKDYKGSIDASMSNPSTPPSNQIVLGDLDTSSKELGSYTTINNRREEFTYDLTRFVIDEQKKINIKLNSILSIGQQVLLVPVGNNEQVWVMVDTVREVDF